MWFKVLNSDWSLNAFQYQLGLNADTVKFDRTGTCKPGGLYFADEYNIAKFLWYGDQIANIKIPMDAETYRDPDGDKWKANKIEIISVCKIEDHPLLQDEKWCLNAVRQNGNILKYIRNQTKEMVITAILQNGNALEYVKEQTYDICLIAVKNYGRAIKFVRNQTKELCLIAVRANGFNIQHIVDQTEELCIEAVKKYGNALPYVQVQTLAICKAAVKQNRETILYVKDEFKAEVL